MLVAHEEAGRGMGQAYEAARAIAFLAEDSDFINGVSLPVAGSWTVAASWDPLRTKTH